MKRLPPLAEFRSPRLRPDELYEDRFLGEESPSAA